MHKSSNGHLLVFIFCWKMPLFYHQCNILDVKNSDADWTLHDNSQVSFKVSSSLWGEPLPVKIFLSPHCRLLRVLMRESTFSWLIYGLQWYVGRHLSLDVNFLNSSFCHERQHRSHHLCVVFRLFKPRKISATLNAVRAQPHSPVGAAHMPRVSVPSQPRI